MKVGFWSLKIVQILADVIGIATLAMPVEPITKFYVVIGAIVITSIGNLLMDTFARVPLLLGGAAPAMPIRNILSGVFNPIVALVFAAVIVLLMIINNDLPAILILVMLWVFFGIELMKDTLTVILLK